MKMQPSTVSLLNKALRRPDKLYTFVTRRINHAIRWNYCYATLRKPKVRTLPEDPAANDHVINDLIKSNFHVIDFQIDLTGYRHYMDSARYDRFPSYYAGGKAENFIEKSLEHYLAAQLLTLSTDDVYIDIANAGCPTPQVYREFSGCAVYRQDLLFHEGLNGNVIGGDAGNMPLENGFATKMALHCSFEHFEQDSDIRFIKEARRVLRKGGKLCILPLYLSPRYLILTDPGVLPVGGIPFESDALLYCKDGWQNRHGRAYDVPHFSNRVRGDFDDFKLTIYVVRNEKQIDPSCYVKFIALFEKL